MTVPATEKVVSARSDATARFEAIYDEHLSLLIAIAVDKFAVPPSDAQTLVHEIFLSFFMNMDDVRDVRSWLVGATCNACRMFIKRRDRDVSATDDLFYGDLVYAGESFTYHVPSLAAGAYVFKCTIHPQTMIGVLVVQ